MSDMKKINDAMTAVRAATDMTPEKKLAELDRLKGERTRLAEQAMYAAKSYKTTPQYTPQ